MSFALVNIDLWGYDGPCESSLFCLLGSPHRASAGIRWVQPNTSIGEYSLVATPSRVRGGQWGLFAGQKAPIALGWCKPRPRHVAQQARCGLNFRSYLPPQPDAFEQCTIYKTLCSGPGCGVVLLVVADFFIQNCRALVSCFKVPGKAGHHAGHPTAKERRSLPSSCLQLSQEMH